MGFRFGQDRYSEHRYSWITEWAVIRCGDAVTEGVATYGNTYTYPPAVQADSRRPGNQQRLGLRPQLELRQDRYLGWAIARPHQRA